MNRKQRRAGVKPTRTSYKINPPQINQSEINKSLFDIMDLFGDETPKEEALKLFLTTGKFAVKDGAVTFRMLPIEEGLKEIDKILADGGTIQYPKD